MDLSFFKKDQEAKTQSKKVLVVSENTEVIKRISEILVLKGFDNVLKVKGSILELSPEKLVDYDIEIVIFYTDKISNEVQYAERLNRIFTKDVIKIVLSNEDSIKINHFFRQEGIIYLNWEYEFSELVTKINEEKDERRLKHGSIRIAVLGSKGGVGNSYVSYQIAKNIRQRYLSPTVLVQGLHSSFTADYYATKNFEKELFSKEGLSYYKETSEDAYRFLNERFNNFNFIIFDHSIQSLSKEEIEDILNGVDLVVVVFDTTPASIRKAKEIHKINNFLLTVGQGTKRLFLCLNNHRKTRKFLNASNLKEIIGTDVDVIIPYKNLDMLDIKNSNPPAITKCIDELTDKLIGAKDTNNSFLKKIFGKG